MGLLVEVGVFLHVQVILLIVYNCERCKEFLQFLLQIVGVDVGTPQDLGIARHFLSSANHIAVEVGARQI